MSQTPQTPGSDVAELFSGSNGSTSTSSPSTVAPGSSAPSVPNQPTAPAAQPSSEGATQVSHTKATYQVSFFDCFPLFFCRMATRHVLSGLAALGVYLHRTLYLGSVHIFFYQSSPKSGLITLFENTQLCELIILSSAITSWKKESGHGNE